MPLYLYNGNLLVRNGGLATSASCCCGNCDCCEEDDTTYGSEYGDNYVVRSWSRVVEASGEAQVSNWLYTYGSSKKASAPARSCLSKARVYAFYRSASAYEPSCSERRYRIYIPDCETRSLIDITDDYTEPTYFESQPGFQRTGFWQWFSTNIASGDCAEYGLTLPDWPDEPMCPPFNCECCVDDNFSTYEPVMGECSYFKSTGVSLHAGGGAVLSVDQWLAYIGATKKESAPERPCLEFARVYSRFACQSNQLDECCRGPVEFGVYIPDCENETLIDITSDYEPESAFSYMIEDRPDVFPCNCPPDVPPLPRLPVCNPLP